MYVHSHHVRPQLIEEGKATLEDCEAFVTEHGEPKQTSGAPLSSLWRDFGRTERRDLSGGRCADPFHVFLSTGKQEQYESIFVTYM